jgi:hypothetical protein
MGDLADDEHAGRRGKPQRARRRPFNCDDRRFA